MDNTKFCNWCSGTDHQRKSSKLCPFNSNNKESINLNAVCEAISPKIKRELSNTILNNVSIKKKTCTDESEKRQERRKKEDDERKHIRLTKQLERNKLNNFKKALGEAQESINLNEKNIEAKSLKIKRELSKITLNNVSIKKKTCTDESAKRQERREKEDYDHKNIRLTKQLDRTNFNNLKKIVGERQESLEKCNASDILSKLKERGNLSDQNNSTDLSESFKNSLKEINFYVCYCCMRNCFTEGIVQSKNLDVKDIYNKFLLNYKNKLKYYDHYVEEKYHFCHTCHGYLKRNKLPSISIINDMFPGDIPEELSKLTDVEIGLISQLRPYMKIISLSGSSFGQKGIKGNVIHFAQCVEEVIEQLPLQAKDSGCIIVSELLIGPNRLKEFKVRGKEVYEALTWLKNNNILYKNVTIVIRNEDELNIPIINSNKDQREIEQPCLNSNMFKNLAQGYSILHGDFHQGASVLLGRFAGRQCTALSVTALCLSFIKCIENWDKETLNYILFKGTLYFEKIINKIGDKNLYLNTDECLTEEYELYDKKIQINCALLNDNEIFRYNCILSENNLLSGIKCFCESDSNLATITLCNYTFALIKEKQNIYFFNSHSCTETGRLSDNGKSCAIKYEIYESDDTLKKLRKTILNFINYKNDINEGEYTFSITPLVVECNNLNNNGKNEMTIPDYDLNALNIDYELNTLISPVDFNAPNIENAKLIVDNEKKFNLKRATTVPINANRENSVEELSFIKIFPFGKFGYKFTRSDTLTKLTFSNYIRARIMSSDNRYQNTQYLFYLMQMYEISKVTSSINFCSSQLKKGNSENRNLHVCLQSLRGYASYWNAICTDLLALIRCLGPPTWFITLSARDLEWEDMLKVLVNEKRKLDPQFCLDKNSDFKERSNLLSEFPVIAARYFNRRFLIFLKLLLKHDSILGGKILDFWYRVEFQTRGSPHIHMLTWIDKCPLFNTEEGIKLIERIIKVQKNPSDVELNELVNRLQPHNCTKTCSKNTKKKCRFDFPKNVCNETRIFSEEELLNGNGKFCELKRTIEDIRINNYNEHILKIWTANMDIQPIGSMYGVAYYVAKYCCKPESAHVRKAVSDALEALKTCPQYEISMRMQNICQVIMANRERSSQEAAYITCGLNLQGSSRTSVFVNTRPAIERTRMVKKECVNNEKLDENSYCSDIYDKYCKRADELNEICLYEFATEYNIRYAKVQEEDELGDEMEVEMKNEKEDKNDKIKYYIKGSTNIFVSKRKKFAALKSPYINIVDEEDEYYYSLMLLYLPFRNEKEILEGTTTVKDAYEKNVKSLRPSHNNGLINKIDELNKALERIEVFRDNSSLNQNAIPDISNLLHHDVIDENDMIVEDEISFIPVEEKTLRERLNLLNAEQMAIYNKLKQNIVKGKDPVRIIIHGYGGTGKSFLSKIIVDTINLHNGNKIENVIVCAPTGVAAKNIGGLTCHSVFRLPIQKFTVGEFLNLTGRILQNMREKWKNINWVIIDEISMVAYSQFRQINLRLQQVKESVIPFGGVNIIIMGDFLQLKPCKNQPRVFEFIPQYLCEIDLWQLFEFHELTINQRQKADKTYGEICCRIREGTQNSNDVNILNSRLLENLLNPEYFNDAVRLYCRKDDVRKYNDTKFQELLSDKINKVYVVSAEDTYGEGHLMNKAINKNDLYSEEEKCGGIPSVISLAIGCRVMLRRNLDVSKGLVNGSMGIVTGFQWEMLRRKPLCHGEVPHCVLVKFDDELIAKNYVDSINGSVKIKPVIIKFQGKSGKLIVRRMIPLIHSWAVTVHKMQGATLTKVVVDLHGGFDYGMEYVSLSRVKSLEGLAISKIKLSRFTNNKFTCPKALNEIKRQKERFSS